MKSIYVNDLQPSNDPFHSIFLVTHKEIRQKKSGDPYLSLTLGDRTGDMDAKMWDNVADVMDTFERDDFVRVKGVLQIFQNRPQLTIHKMQRVDERDIVLADYFPASTRDPEEMWAELQSIVAGIANPHLRALLEVTFGDARIAQAFKIAPAAKTIHHAFLSGLMEHVLSLCALCRSIAPNYRNIDVDLLLTGALLHDLGKIDELSYERGFSYSDEGQLLGHILMGIRMIDEKLRTLPDFPPKLRLLVEHMILSHHGQLEFGSPKVPVFPEALLLHHLDNLDSKMECMRALVQKDALVLGNWTAYCAPLERSVLKKARFMGEQPVPQPAGLSAAAPGSSSPIRSEPAVTAPPEPPQRATLGDLTSKFNVTRNR